MWNKYISLGICVIGVTALCVAIFIPRVAIMESTSYKAEASIQARAVAVALLSYTHSNQIERLFPDDVYALETLGLSRDVTKYRDPGSGAYYDWLYFGRGIEVGASSLDSDFILIAVPTLFDQRGMYPEEGQPGMRVVCYMDGMTDVIPEAEFVSRVKAQKDNTIADSLSRR